MWTMRKSGCSVFNQLTGNDIAAIPNTYTVK